MLAEEHSGSHVVHETVKDDAQEADASHSKKCQARKLPGAVREEIGVYVGLNGVQDERDFVSRAWDFLVDGTLLVQFDRRLLARASREVPRGSCR